ncbi:hypothetical protein [Azotobacter salinestris]|uniref:hypothetical protein n=1 Tax=Azotobacter salinestris TaxID=69964 RepID=UPI0032DE9F98
MNEQTELRELAALVGLESHRLTLDAQALKQAISGRNPCNPLSADLVAEIRRRADGLLILAAKINAELRSLANADRAKPKMRPAVTAGQIARRQAMKRGCLVGDIDAPGFGL